jgi:hypothetical protein
MVLLTLIMAGGLTFYRSANLQLNKPQQQIALSSTMARAKEALIAYAVTDDKHPGSLPCPDLMTDSSGWSNYPGDGKTDIFTDGICPSNVGWLPWVSPLDLPELVDDSSTRLWYVLTPYYRNHNSAEPINSDTPTKTFIGKTPVGIFDFAPDLTNCDPDVCKPEACKPERDIAALIIAPRRPLPGQNRPSNDPADYLDGENGNGYGLINNNIYVTGPQSETFNDVVLVITRQELMAAVEKRVANEVNSCLTQHAASAANTDKRYPWPAPLTSVAFQGNTNTLFGRVPSTQPDAGLDAQIKASITKLNEAKLAVENAADASKQLTALNALAQNAVEARNLFDAMYTAFNKTKQLADDVHSKKLDLSSRVTSATSNGRISRSEGTQIRDLITPPPPPPLTPPYTPLHTGVDSLITQLGETGIDVFPWEINRLNDNLNKSLIASLIAYGDTNVQKAIQLLQIEVTAIQSLLAATSTPRTDISAYLTSANTAANIAVAAANASLTLPSDTTLLLAAQSAATALKGATIQLITSVDNSRINILSGQVSDYVPPLENLKSSLKASTTKENVDILKTSLRSTRKSLEAIRKGDSTIVAARDAATSSLTTAIEASEASTLNYKLIDDTTTIALNNIKTLRAAIAVNEQVDNNVSRTSLTAALAIYQTARSDFTSQDTATPRPRASTITPYAKALSDATVHIDIWAKSITENAAAVAPQAKAAPVPESTKITDVIASETSAYSAANNALTSISGKGESAELLQTYINTPNATNQTQAISALAETTALIDSLLTQANTLDNDISATTASAGPLIWLASRCDFLLPSKATWWSNNKWANTVFYQISTPLMATAGKLKVNGVGSYRTVTLAAGKKLPVPTLPPPCPERLPLIEQFLEDINADNSRNGLALTPTTGFISKPISSTFNDRLAY